jgi:hypothetical protein
MRRLSILLLAIFVCLLPTVTFAGYGVCLAKNGRNGVCISTDACAGSGGVSDPGNLCPGDSSIEV